MGILSGSEPAAKIRGLTAAAGEAVGPERWLSGRKHRFAKAAYGSNCTAGSNPALSG